MCIRDRFKCAALAWTHHLSVHALRKQRICLLWPHFLGSFSRVLAASWPHLGASWPPLGLHFGIHLGHPHLFLTLTVATFGCFFPSAGSATVQYLFHKYILCENSESDCHGHNYWTHFLMSWPHLGPILDPLGQKMHRNLLDWKKHFRESLMSFLRRLRCHSTLALLAPW